MVILNIILIPAAVFVIGPRQANLVLIAYASIRAVSLLAHTSSESRGTCRQKAPVNGWACAINICHDGMLEDTNSLDGAHIDNKGFSPVDVQSCVLAVLSSFMQRI